MAVCLRPDLRPLGLTVVNYGREEAMRSRSLNLLSQTGALLSVVTMALLPAVVYLVQAQTEKGGRVLTDMPSCKPSSVQAC